MLPFSRKKDKDKEEKPEEEIVKPVRRRKKKKEEIKPWTHKERIIIFALLLLIPIVSLIFFFKSKNSGSLFGSGNNVLGVTASMPSDPNELKNKLSSEIQSQKGTYGIWVQSLDGSFSVGINEKNEFDGASLFKLPLMVAYYEGIDNGSLDENTTYSLKYSDSEAGTGALASLPVGTSVTYKDMVNAMGKDSDNTAFQVMGNIIGFNKIDNTIGSLGMSDTSFENSSTTPEDIGLLFYKLVNSNLLSNNSRNELLSSLTNTNFENLIPAGLPPGIRVAHKYATDSDELNDAGIVYTSKPFILVILSKGINTTDASIEISKIAKIVYDWSMK